MIIRNCTTKDIVQLRMIHDRDYPDLEFPFDYHLLSSFVIEDDGKIIMGGGIQGSAEALLTTDKSCSRVKIGRALVEAQRNMMISCALNNLQELIAFVTDDEYAEHLIQHGFTEREEKVLRMKVYG